MKRGISFTAAQAAWEARNAEPPEQPTPFLETKEGQDWLESTADDLLTGRVMRVTTGQRGPSVSRYDWIIALTEREDEAPITGAEIWAAKAAGSESVDVMTNDYRQWAIGIAKELLTNIAQGWADAQAAEAKADAEIEARLSSQPYDDLEGIY